MELREHSLARVIRMTDAFGQRDLGLRHAPIGDLGQEMSDAI
jgi:hypothetical protein